MSNFSLNFYRFKTPNGDLTLTIASLFIYNRAQVIRPIKSTPMRFRISSSSHNLLYRTLFQSRHNRCKHRFHIPHFHTPFSWSQSAPQYPYPFKSQTVFNQLNLVIFLPFLDYFEHNFDECGIRLIVLQSLHYASLIFSQGYYLREEMWPS